MCVYLIIINKKTQEFSGTQKLLEIEDKNFSTLQSVILYVFQLCDLCIYSKCQNMHNMMIGAIV